MRRPLATFALAAVLALVAGCKPRPAEPTAVRGGLARAVAEAIDAEARDAGAYQPWLDVLAEAARSADDPSSVAATAAALDALAHRDPPNDALVHREREAFARVVLRMREIWESTDARRGAYAPLVAGLIARSMHTLALTTGEAKGANLWAERRGCVPAVTAFGPVDSAPLGALTQRSAVPARGPMPTALRGLPPFSSEAAPNLLRADACTIELRATGGTRGLREAVVDLRVDGEQDVTFALTSDGPASLEVGGERVLLRTADAGDGTVLRFARAHATGGVLRAVVRVADRGQGAGFELDAWGEDGFTLASKAPLPGDAADATAKAIDDVDVTRLDPRAGGADGDDVAAGLVMLATAELALGETRAAFRRIDAEIERKKAAAGAGTAPAHAPRFWLIALRALDGSDEISDTRRSERARDAARRVLDAWPDAWEARIADARSAADRRGPEEGPFVALEQLGVEVDAEGGDPPATLDGLTVPELGFVASVADGARLRDVAERAYATLARKAPGSFALARVDAAVHDRAGDEAVRAACEGGLSRATTTCFSVRRQNGDLDGALAEIERLRVLRSAPDALRDLELAVRIDKGDLAGVLAIYDGLPRAQRAMLPALGLAAARGDTAAARARLARDAAVAGDAPQAIGPLLQLLEGGSPEAKRLEAKGREITERDRKNPAMKGAATAVLEHVEHYGLDESGLLHFVVYDVRRVGGTTDVDQNAAAALPFVEGRGNAKLLRRRVIKKDGRVLHPDAASMASQGNTDLSQLETGDYVEQIVEGYYLPNDQGQLVLDTPDLLPERTSVLSAEIVVRVPEKLPLSIWSHPRFGSPGDLAARAEKRDGYVLHTFRLQDAPPRRLEDDVPQLERGVRVSLGTLTWAEVARGVAETVRATDVRDPYVLRFAREAAGLAPGEAPKLDEATIARVVSHVGDVIKEPHPFELTDMGSTMTGQTSIRAAIEDREGSRTTIVARSLEALGFSAEIAIAEPEPFATSERVPPHTGRFRHPLVVVRLGGKDVWIDADLRGAPLPPGQVSSELRGRAALLASGPVVPVQGATSVGGDEIDLRLAVDPQGDAKGTLVATIRGRAAQALNDAFQQVVGSEQKQMLRTVVLGWVPWADVDEVTMATDVGAWQLRIRADIAVSGFARPEGKDGSTWVLPGVEPVHYVFPRPYATTLGTTYTSQRERTTALSIEWPLQFVMKRTITLPPSAKVARSPAPVEVSGAVLRATRKSEVKGNEVTDEFRLDLPTGTVAADAYPDFARDVQAVDSGFLAGTRVEVAR